MHRRSMPMPPAGDMPCFEGDVEIFVELLLFVAGLVFQSLALLNGIVLLRVSQARFPGR